MDPYSSYSYSYGSSDAGMFAVMMGLMATYGLVMLIICIVSLIGMWKVYEKAGKPGWAAIIPFYNYYVLVEIVGRPVWWFFLLFIPVVNAVVGIILLWDLTRSFGQGAGFFFGLLFLNPIFFPILGFGSARYLGPAGAQTGYTPPTPSYSPPVPPTPAPPAPPAPPVPPAQS